MSKTFSLANESFTLSTELKDSIRREQYFQNPKSGAQLNAEELRLLSTLGIDTSMEQTLRPYLRDFFDELPNCTSDASLRLSRKCEIPYYVIWATEFANHSQKVNRVNDYPEHKTRAQIVMAEDGAIIDELKPVPEKIDEYDKLFTLVPVSKKSVAVSSNLYEKVFRLVKIRG